MRLLSIDPDLHDTAWSYLDTGSDHLTGGVVSIQKGLKGDSAVEAMACRLRYLNDALPWCDFLDACLVESQELPRMHKAAPKDIIRLAQVAGAAVATVGQVLKPSAKVCLVSPQVWKGQVPKEIHHARICTALGWEFEKKSGYCVPSEKHWSGFRVRVASDWKHLLDAIGMCLWFAKTGSKLSRFTPTGLESTSCQKV